MLDGHPKEAESAVELEKLLTGLDLEAEKLLIDQASRLAPPPSDLLPDLNRALDAGFDVVLCLNASDTEMLIERAVNKQKSQKQPMKKGSSKDNSLDSQVTLLLSAQTVTDVPRRKWNLLLRELKKNGHAISSSCQI